MEKPNEHKKSIVSALAEIAAIEQQIRMGPVDSEIDAIEDMRNKLQRGELTPEEAVEQAEELERNRSSHYR